jgi:DNA-binding transcriptional regulator YiaG
MAREKDAGHRIKAALEELDISQAEFAREIDANPRTVTRWVLGQRQPSTIVLKYLDLRVKLHRLSKGDG